MGPQNGSATVTIYGDPSGGEKQEIHRIESVAGSWSLWDHQQNSANHITLKVTNGGTAPGAADVSAILYFFRD